MGRLGSKPSIGRPRADGSPEPIAGRGVRSRIALYEHDERMDLMSVLAIRSQRESGYHHP